MEGENPPPLHKKKKRKEKAIIGMNKNEFLIFVHSEFKGYEITEL